MRCAVITTAYKGPTECRGSRIVARRSDTRQRVTMSYRSELNSPDNHREAAKLLLDKLPDFASLSRDHGPTGTGYVFLALPR